jgi:DNA-binding LacI/PurR family transcriptional regulator
MMDRRPTIEDVARAAGVSRATTSRVINHLPGASDQVRARVNQAVTDLGYQPNAAARALASGRAPVIDLVIVAHENKPSELGVNPYFSRVMAGMLTALDGTDTAMRVRMVSPSDASEALDRVADTVTTGAVLVNVPPTMATRFHRRCPRVVSLGATAAQIPAVEAENASGAHTAVAQLYALGRRRIAAVHGPDRNTCAASRRAGHLDAIHDVGLRDIAANGDFWRDGGYRAATQLLEREPKLDALFAACDLMAVGAVQAIVATGRRIPDDVAVIGFDDSILAAAANPSLSTVRLPVEDMAVAATRMLLDDEAKPYARRTFSVGLVERNSTSPGS